VSLSQVARRAASAAACLALLAACGSGAAPPAGSPDAAASGAGSPAGASNGILQASGEGPGGSEAFDLQPGDYVLTWSAAPAAGADMCHHRAALETTDEEIVQPVVDQDVTAAIADQQVPLDGQVAGTYYIDLNSDCAWTFRVDPRP
jgi:hypothetical protein